MSQFPIKWGIDSYWQIFNNLASTSLICKIFAFLETAHTKRTRKVFSNYIGMLIPFHKVYGIDQFRTVYKLYGIELVWVNSVQFTNYTEMR